MKMVAAQRFLARHRLRKSIGMEREKKRIVEVLKNGGMKRFDGKGRKVPENFMKILNMMTHLNGEEDYVKTAFEMLNLLNIDVNLATESYDQAVKLRDLHPEAAEYTQKIERMRNMEEEEESDEEEEDDGYESAEEEDLMEEEEIQGFQKALIEVKVMILSKILISKDDRLISLAVGLLPENSPPLSLCLKYEIPLLLVENGTKNQAARALFSRIMFLEDHFNGLWKQKVFDHLLAKYSPERGVTDGKFMLLMKYLTPNGNKFYVKKVVKLLLELPITLHQTQFFELRKRMMDMPRMTHDMALLIMRVRDIEDEAAAQR
uniref:TPR_REGION domain-containing protein n=3 Tax=Caenorhabditis tropicalis TaxID=1561998 RepID=A0A1I7U7Q5_9PELO